MEEEEIKNKLAEKLAEREAIVAGKSRITPEQERTYNNLGKDIRDLRRLMY